MTTTIALTVKNESDTNIPVELSAAYKLMYMLQKWGVMKASQKRMQEITLVKYEFDIDKLQEISNVDKR